MARGRHSLVLEVQMDHFRYCTDNFLGVESVAPECYTKTRVQMALLFSSVPCDNI